MDFSAGGVRLVAPPAPTLAFFEKASCRLPSSLVSPTVNRDFFFSVLNKMRNYEAVIFDMDGVIVDSEPRHEQAFREIFAEMGYGETHGMDFAAYYGRTDKALWLDFIEKHRPAQDLTVLTEWKQRRFLEILHKEKPIFTAVPSLLSRLQPVYQLALASGSAHPVIEAVLGLRDLKPFFPIVVSAHDVPRGKPAPDIFLRASELLAIPPHRCCVVEDSAAGVEAARAAGMEVIAILNTLPREKLAKATWVVANYDEIEGILLPTGRQLKQAATHL